MSITGPGSVTAASVLAQTNMSKQLDQLSQELGTGQAAQTYSGLGSQAGLALALKAQLSAIDGYDNTATTVGTTLSIAESTLNQIGSLGSTVEHSVAQQGAFSLDNTGQTPTQEAAASYLGQLLALLNTQVGNNYIFSGSAANQPSVAGIDEILNGSGGAAGLKQAISERQLADLGANGLGRLLIPAPSASTVSISEDAANSPFGVKLAGVNSSLTGATVSGPSGSPASISVALAANPNPGDSISFSLTLPDGASQTVTLKATAASPPGANQFTIGANPSATANNLQAALAAAAGSVAQTSLPAASAIAAANNFFSSDPPQRVDGPPFDTAVSLVNGTPANTVFWYTGENGSTPPRQTALAQVGPAMAIAFGMRANEPAISSLIANVAAFAAVSYSASDPNAQASYEALSQSVTANLDGRPGTQAVSDIEADLANAQTTMTDAGNLNSQTKSTLQDMLQGIEGIDQTKIGAELLTLQNNLSASMSVTARLAQLSLVNYLSH